MPHIDPHFMIFVYIQNNAFMYHDLCTAIHVHICTTVYTLIHNMFALVFVCVNVRVCICVCVHMCLCFSTEPSPLKSVYRVETLLRTLGWQSVTPGM